MVGYVHCSGKRALMCERLTVKDTRFGNSYSFIFVNLSAWKVTEISKISVVMYVSDNFLGGKMQLTEYLGLCWAY